jgi:hypothetical protein
MRGKPKKGLYKPQNPEKYIQPKDKTMNSKEFPEYRSSWELHFYRYCDISPAVEYWSTEYIAIPYISPLDQKQHRYYPDVFVIFKNKEKMMIEIKPYKEQFLNENKRITEKMKRTYLVNQAKWEAAKTFAELNNYKFIVMNEYDLGIKKPKS